MRPNTWDVFLFSTFENAWGPRLRTGGFFAPRTARFGHSRLEGEPMSVRGNERCKCSICGAPFARRWAANIGPHVNYCPEHHDELAAVADDPFAFEVRRRRLEREGSR
jgi:hypothetical protein